MNWARAVVALSVVAVILAIVAVALAAAAFRKNGGRGKRGRSGPMGPRGPTGLAATGPTGGAGAAVGPTGSTGPAGGGGGGSGGGSPGTGSYVGFSSNNLLAEGVLIAANNLGEGTVVLMNTDPTFNVNGPAASREQILDEMCLTANRPGMLQDLYVVLGGGGLTGAGYFGSGTGAAQIWMSNSSVVGETGWAPTPLAVEFPFSETGPVFYTLSNTDAQVAVAPFDRFALVFDLVGATFGPMMTPVPTGPLEGPLNAAYSFSACSAGLTYF